MSRRQSKSKPKPKMIREEAVAMLRPLVASLNERLATIRVMMGIPKDWKPTFDQGGVPIGFVPPEEG